LSDYKDNVVTEFKIGKTKVKICDDYCRNKNKEEIDKILNRISQNINVNCI